MPGKITYGPLPLMISLITLFAGGCASLFVGAATEAGKIIYTERGAKSIVLGDLPQVEEEARSVFREMNITVTGYEEVSNTTRAEIIAQESFLNWNKQYAQQILERLVKEG